jgi:hypothetical protein
LTADSPGGAIEVMLRQADGKVECEVTWLNEGTTGHDLQSRSLRHAKREVRAWLARDEWVPVDGWSRAGTDGNQITRHFQRRPANDRLLPLVR